MNPFITSSDFVNGSRYHVLINGQARGPFTKDEVLDQRRRGVISEETRACVTNPHLQASLPSVASWMPIRTLLPEILDRRWEPSGGSAAVVDCPNCGVQLRITDSESVLRRCPSCRVRLRIRFNPAGRTAVDVETEDRGRKEPVPPPPAAQQGWKSPYEILGIGTSATPAEIKAAYRRRIREYHPDKVAALGLELRALAEEKTKLIVEAYARLTDSAPRK